MNTWDRGLLKDRARRGLRLNYWRSVLVGIISMIVATGIIGLPESETVEATMHTLNIQCGGNVLNLLTGGTGSPLMLLGIATSLVAAGTCVLICLIRVFVLNPLEIGCSRFYYRNLSEKAEIKEVCYTYDKGCLNGVFTLFLRDVYTLLWGMLLIVPGIVKYYEYIMVPFILSENPDMDRHEVFALSKAMMQGNKGRAFLLDLSFVLWDVLGIFTFGVVNVFYVIPYKRMTMAALYQELKMA